MLEGFEGAVIGRALTAAGTLDKETADRVVDEYELQALADIARGPKVLPRGLTRHLAAQERTLVNLARLVWVAMARETLIRWSERRWSTAR